jgi:hypothetical protein
MTEKLERKRPCRRRDEALVAAIRAGVWRKKLARMYGLALASVNIIWFRHGQRKVG